MALIDDTTVLVEETTERRPLKKQFAHVVNVKNFGALGNDNGSGTTGHDDTANIQAAIDWTDDPIRGCIYFPPGIYRVTAPLTFNDHPDGEHSVVFRGAGGLGSQIVGSVDGYILDRDNDFISGNLAQDAFEHLHIHNTHTALTSGCIRWGAAAGVHVRNCTLQGANGFTSGPFLFGFSLHNCEINPAGISPAGNGIHVASGGPTVISGCDIIGMDKGVYIQQGGATIICCRFEMNEAYGVHSIAGAVIENCSFEANDVAAWIRGGAAIRDCGALGDAFSGGAAVTKVGNGTVGSPIITVADASDVVVGMSVSDNTGVTSAFWGLPQGHYVVSKNTGVTPHQVTLSKNNIGTATYPGVRKTGCVCTISNVVITVPDPSGLSVGMNAEDLDRNVLWVAGSGETTAVTIAGISGTSITLSRAPVMSATCTIDFGTSFHFNTFATGAFLVEASDNNVFENVVASGYFSSYFFKAGYDTSLTLRNCFAQDNIDITDASRRIIVEAPVYLGARIRTEGCNFSYAHTFATLPTVASGTTYGDPKLPRQGEKLFISDGGAQAIGAVVTGSGDLGSTFMEVMWTGSAWRRVA